MNKAFLRSGKLENYLPLGENGQAVYVSALQLRETLRLQKKIILQIALPSPNPMKLASELTGILLLMVKLFLGRPHLKKKKTMLTHG